MRGVRLAASLLGIAVLSACGSGAGVAGPSGPGGPVPPVDPLALAGEVSEAELTATIQGLQQLPTRHTFGTGDEQARDHLVARLAALGLTAELDSFPVGGETASNVIVRHPGRDDPNVVYILAGHYDSTSDAPGTTAPGADDNASGVASVLEAARLLTRHAFRHSLWFVFTGAEEQGSLGSQHMVQWITAQGIDVRGVVVPDMIGYWPLGDQDELDILGDTGSVALVEHVADVATRLGVPHRKWIEHGYCYGDDHTRFQEAGIPAIATMDCVEAHNLPGSGETTPHYHRTTDTMDTLHMPLTTRVVGVMVAALAELAGSVSSESGR